MKILALYVERTLSMVRRIQAPFSVLSSRAHAFSFMQIPTFEPGHASGYDVTVLPNWVLSDEEREALLSASHHTNFLYDLSDLDLLQKSTVRDTMRLCRYVTVPNMYMQHEVEVALPGTHVAITPSCMDIPYFMTGNTSPRASSPCIGCVGPYDWHLVKDALYEVKMHSPKTVFLGDAGAQEVLGECITRVNLTVESYPHFLHSCLFGLAPIERARGQELLWVHEYGLLCKPVIQRRGNVLAEMRQLLFDSSYRSECGQLAHKEAKQHSAVLLADQYLKVYRKLLPILR